MNNNKTEYITTPGGTTLIYDKHSNRVKSKRDKYGNIFVLNSKGKYKKVDKI